MERNTLRNTWVWGDDSSDEDIDVDDENKEPSKDLLKA